MKHDNKIRDINLQLCIEESLKIINFIVLYEKNSMCDYCCLYVFCNVNAMQNQLKFF